MRVGPDHQTTENDEFIARALAEQEEEEARAADVVRRRQQQQQQQQSSNYNTLQYPGDRLQQHQVPYQAYAPPSQPYPATGGGGQSSASSSYSHPYSHPPPAYYGASAPTSASTPQRNDNVPPTPPFGMTRQQQPQQRTPMCHIPCVVGPNSVCVEMMVDTGAECSVISEQLAKDIGLYHQMDRRAQGIAAGVGQAKIVGQIRNAVVTLGHVEFLMEFMVLQIPNQRLLLLGLDQMRKYKCIVNLEKDVLVFGGTGGVEVNMLPPDPQRHIMVPGIGGSCTIS